MTNMSNIMHESGHSDLRSMDSNQFQIMTTGNLAPQIAEFQPALVSVAKSTENSASEIQKIFNAKMMIVCDDLLNIDVMRAFLQQVGYNSIISSGELSEVFELIFNERPDVILFESSGLKKADFDLLEKIRNNRMTRLVPIVILTAIAEKEAKLKALELGVVDVLIKPVTSKELELRLRNILSVKTYHDHIAHYDTLTNLPNRESFISRLNWALKYSKRYNTTGAVLQIGLNRFKNVNDALGSSVGDSLLKAVAERIKDILRQSDIVSRTDEDASESTLSRLGGDEFTVLLPVMAHAEDAAIVTQRVQEHIALPFLIGENELHITCNVGISVFPDDGISKEEIMHGAGVSLHQTKRDGQQSYMFYSKKLNDKTMYRLAMETDMRKALEEEQFRVFYQPKINLKTRQLIGAEALIRWKHPERGIISPVEFIPLAEETGLILPIGNWVIGSVCKQIGDWQLAGLTVPRIAVNVSSHQFRHQQLLEDIKSGLELAKVDAQYLTVELTESAVMSNAKESIRILDVLKEMGIRISIDDFGTGYSSLAHLKQLPLDELKIDRSFIIDIGKEKNTEAIILAIIGMAHRLGLSVVAEGVETKEQRSFLDQYECDEYQGYLFSQPISADRFSLMLGSQALAIEAE